MRSEDSVPHRLQRLFAPTSIALVGASDRNMYSQIAVENLSALDYAGSVHMVNPRGGTVLGKVAAKKCKDIGELVDLAYVTVPLAGALDAVSEAIEAGIKNLVMVTSGFAEAGPEGLRLQTVLAEMLQKNDVRMLGPNCLGFLNYADKTAVGAIAAAPAIPSSVALVSVSGACATEVMNYAARIGLGFTHVIATGNEVEATMGDVLDYLIEHPAVGAVAMFAEMIRDPAIFAAAARKALDRKKPVVILKVGSSPNTAAIATAHTGAILGDDRVFSAVCHRLGVIRVTTFEDLVITAHTLANVGPLRRRGVAVISTSGGVCDVVSDLAETHGVSLPAFAAETARELTGIISSFGQIHNPMDLTGAVARDPSMYEKVIRAIGRDPQIGLIICHQDLPFNPRGETETLMDRMHRLLLDSIAKGLRAANMPPIILVSYGNAINLHGHRELHVQGFFAIPGISNGIAALGKAAWWFARLGSGSKPFMEQSCATQERPRGEHEVMNYLRRQNVPVIPSSLVNDAESAVRHSQQIGYPVALKIASPDIAHKTDIGGVLLNIRSDAAVADGFREIVRKAALHAPLAHLDGVLVCPMRTLGLELIVGFLRDPQWGLTLALGLGGVWVDVLQDVVVRVLPVDQDDIVAALGELRAARLLQGYRNLPSADVGAIAGVIVRIAAAVLELGTDLKSFEVNPLFVNGGHIEALDALAEWQ